MGEGGDREALTNERTRHARAIARAGGVNEAIEAGWLARRLDLTVAEAIVLGLLRQGVRRFLCLLGHDVTEIGEILRVYEDAAALRTYAVRNQIEAAHAAMALRWVTGEKAAVLASFGAGALQALAGSFSAASNGVGVWHIYGDEPTPDNDFEGTQVQHFRQHLLLGLCTALGEGYSLHRPGDVGVALRRGLNVVDHPHRGGPFFLLVPRNVQSAELQNFDIDELPIGAPPRLGAAAEGEAYASAAAALRAAKNVVLHVGGGAREAGGELTEFLDLVDGVAVISPAASGVIPHDHPRNMTVVGAGSSISGKFALENADLLVAVGTRSVYLPVGSRTAFPNLREVICVNTDVHAATGLARTTALVGDAAPTLQRLIEEIRKSPPTRTQLESEWLRQCRTQRRRWDEFLRERYDHPCLFDDTWCEEVLTQPAAIKTALEWARAHDVVTFFDAGEVQVNGSYLAADDKPGRTFTETGAGYMGFAASAVLATALASKPFYAMAVTGDSSFTMNPQILIDGAAHGARGCLLILDNRRMGGIAHFQEARYGAPHASGASVAVNYVAWARSVRGVAAFDGGRSPQDLLAVLDAARAHPGVSLVHVPVYWGPNPRGSLSAC